MNAEAPKCQEHIQAQLGGVNHQDNGFKTVLFALPEMEMMKMQQRAGFKLHACRQKRDEEIS
eukprot:COSAG02_NODE_32577_length_514_cov_0.867470_1_plen_61_part_01